MVFLQHAKATYQIEDETFRVMQGKQLGEHHPPELWIVFWKEWYAGVAIFMDKLVTQPTEEDIRNELKYRREKEEKAAKPKHVIVWRNDLKVSKGKFASQIAHAAKKWIFDVAKWQQEQYDNQQKEAGVTAEPAIFEHVAEILLQYEKGTALDKWINGSFTEVVVYVNSEEELLEIHKRATEAKLISTLIIDNGLTEFNGVKTPTCVGIGPDRSDLIDEITGHLPLLK